MASNDWPQTRAERTDFQETSRYTDVVAFLRQLQKRGAPLSLRWMGSSPKGRRIPLAIASRPLVLSPAEARNSGRPVVYIQANIHGGEVEGKEAALHLLRAFSQEGRGGILDQLILLIAPIYNIDGNENWGPQETHRPGQNGPAIVGTRANGAGLDLNRDCMKLESPEMRGVLAHVYSWDPHAIIDLHTTNGTRQGYELSYAPMLNPSTETCMLGFTRDELLPAVRKGLRGRYRMETFDYGNVANRGGRPAWRTFSPDPRFVTNYGGLRNRITVLSEAISYFPFKERVIATERFVKAVLDFIAENAQRVITVTARADAQIARWGKDPQEAPRLGVRFALDRKGEANVYIQPPRRKGARKSKGNPAKFVWVKMPVFDRFKATRTTRFPSGYIIPADMKNVVALLQRHGIIVQKGSRDQEIQVQEFLIRKAYRQKKAFQRHRLVRLEGRFVETTRKAKAGDFLVPTAQPLGLLAFHLLEPESLDGVAAWGLLHHRLKPRSAFPVVKYFGRSAVRPGQVGGQGSN
ncbi:MAG: M14 family metallopeptidase [bacterium]